MPTDEVAPAAMLDRIAGTFGGFGDETEPAIEEVTTEEVAETGDEPVDDGLFDLPWEGQTVRVPQSMKEAFMRNEDYTRKTQSIADKDRTLDQRLSLADAQMSEAAFERSVADEKQQIAVMDLYMKNVSGIDWSQMPTDQMIRQKIEIDGIKERRALLADSVNSKKAQFLQGMQAQIDALRGKTREIVSKSIIGFNEETERTIRDYAKSEGLNEREIDRALLDPRSYKILSKAAQLEKVKAGTQQATEKVAKTVLKPGVAGERPLTGAAQKSHFDKALKGARTSQQKAAVIESALGGMFGKRK